MTPAHPLATAIRNARSTDPGPARRRWRSRIRRRRRRLPVRPVRRRPARLASVVRNDKGRSFFIKRWSFRNEPDDALRGGTGNVIDKTVASPEAVADIPDGATIMIGGFGAAGQPAELIDALIAQGATDPRSSTTMPATATGLAALLKARRVRRIPCSFPRQVDSRCSTPCTARARSNWNRAAGQSGCPIIRCRHRGSLHADRLRDRTCRRQGRRIIDGRPYVLEIRSARTLAFIKALRADRWGNPCPPSDRTRVSDP